MSFETSTSGAGPSRRVVNDVDGGSAHRSCRPRPAAGRSAALGLDAGPSAASYWYLYLAKKPIAASTVRPIMNHGSGAEPPVEQEPDAEEQRRPSRATSMPFPIVLSVFGALGRWWEELHRR